ncbi:MAG: type II secretion system F family protein, partial [Lachnospiraceae bacterium]|nr:type II secretion system F family protein [Lachnospiraceae bacterium]
MGQYTYVAVTPQGKEKKGNIEAGDEAKVKALLKKDGLLPISITPAGVLSRDINISLGAAVKPRELAVF